MFDLSSAGHDDAAMIDDSQSAGPFDGETLPRARHIGCASSAPVAELRAQIEDGFSRLRFRDALEPAFRTYLRASGRWSRRGMLAIAFLALLCAIFFDTRMLGLPPSLIASTRLFEFGLMMPAVVIAALCCCFLPDDPRNEFILLVAFVAFCAGLIVQRVIDAAQGFDLPVELISATALGMFTLSRIRFWWMLLATLVVFVAVAAAELFFIHVELNANYHLFGAGVLVMIGVVAGYSLEYFIRWTWLNGMLLHYLSRLDSLTGLLNRQALEQALQRTRAHTRRERLAYGIAMIDIDAFGAYNGQYGHPAGDQALRRIADAIHATARRPLDVCARYGGEEFVVLWVDNEQAALETLAQQLRTTIERMEIRHAVSPVAPWVTVSIGLCHVGVADGGVDPQRALAVADRLLYRSKAAGRNRLCSGTLAAGERAARDACSADQPAQQQHAEEGPDQA